MFSLFYYIYNIQHASKKILCRHKFKKYVLVFILIGFDLYEAETHMAQTYFYVKHKPYSTLRLKNEQSCHNSKNMFQCIKFVSYTIIFNITVNLLRN